VQCFDDGAVVVGRWMS
jgi:hypothetical protein